MTVHVFGNCSSPAVATLGIRTAAKEGENIFGSDVKDFVHRDFYVDDALTSLETTEQAIDLMKRTQQTLDTHGNIRLHKVSSNSKTVMEAFPIEDRAGNLKDVDLGSDVLPVQRSLGLHWDLETDCLRFRVNPEEKPYTKRGILSTINSLYDPLGFVSPALLRGRILLRELMAEKTTWDEELPPEIEKEWVEFKTTLNSLDNLDIPRTYFSTSFQQMVKKELHVFSDASEKAIAAAVYLRASDNDGGTHTSFVLGKTKVAPTHGHTVPRLELCAAVLVVEIAEVVCEELDMRCEDVKFHTGSRIVLGYIHNQTRRFYIYVCNRVARIRRSSDPRQWTYVSTDRNPADSATRSISAENLKQSNWLNGPSILDVSDTEATFPLENPDGDKELRPEAVTMNTSITPPNGLGTQRFERLSSWRRLVNAIALIKKLARNCHKSDPGKDLNQLTNVEAFKEAERFIIKQVQCEAYPLEILALTNGKALPRDSSLLALNPILDSHGVLCVGGRLNQSNLPSRERNPYIIPSSHHISTLLVRHHHQAVKHQGRHLTEGAVRSAGLWIVGGKRLVSRIIHECVICRKLRGREASQQMADLPSDRLTPGPPFTAVGLDVLGPWTVSSRRTRGGLANSKRWAVLFTCLTTRAIHLEVIEEMSSSCFINALRRFIAIRGEVKEFRSDRGTNFIGATESLGIKSIKDEDNPVQRFLQERGTTWTFNTPHSSHMGGVWERMIGTTRRILDSMLLTNPRLTHEVLVTFLAEVSGIVNARPLVPVSTDPENPTVLSPSILLAQKSDQTTSLGENLDVRDIYRSQWKHVQLLAENFWKRWRSEYLQSLQVRRKWKTDQRNIKPGDVVLLKEKQVHRNEWPVGVVTRVFPSVDDKVRKVEVRTTREGTIVTYPRPITEVVLLLSD